MIMADLLRSDRARPRVTYYDEAPGPTQGERIELSAIALDNWVAKASNLLVEEFDAGPGTVITLRLPHGHWRTLYWALGVFATGAALDLTGAADSALVITDDPATAADPSIVVTLPALARRHPGPLPAGALDEAAEISGYPDVPIAPATPAAGDRALITVDGEFDYAALVPEGPASARVLVTESGADFLRRCLAVWAGDGSVVLVNGADEGTLARRLVEERVDGAH
jgi:uncharacterized protein (TIGR03089 family)